MIKNFLLEIWKSWGIEQEDRILLHSSFKRTFNYIRNNGYNFVTSDVLDSLIEYFSPNGTIVFPTFNFSFNDGEKYEYHNTPSQMGIVTELARKHPSAVRTLNPVYSFAIFGKDAFKFNNIDNSPINTNILDK